MNNVSSLSPTIRSASKSSKPISYFTLWEKSTNYKNTLQIKVCSKFSSSSRMHAKSSSGLAQKLHGRKSIKESKSLLLSPLKFTSLLSVTMKIINNLKKIIRDGNYSISFKNLKEWESYPCSIPKTISLSTHRISKF